MNGEDWIKKHKQAVMLLSWTSLMIVLLTLLVLTGSLSKCGSGNVKNKYIDVPRETPTASPSAGPTVEPTVSPTVEPTVEPTVNPTEEPTCDKVTWQDVEPLVAGKCADCHPGFSSYEAGLGGIDEWIRRVNLSSQDPRRMPKLPKPELFPEEKDLLEQWRSDGLIKDKDCAPVETSGLLDIDYVERAMLDDLGKIDKKDQIFIRYLVAADLVNQGQSTLAAKSAVDKLLNSLVEKERDITLSSFIDRQKSIFRFDLRTFELERIDWLKIEAKDKLNLVSRTNAGTTLQRLIATRKPWLHARNFLEIVTNEAKLYYDFVGVPQKFTELVDKLGVDYADDLENLDATLIGNNDSPLTNQKNRLLSRHDSLDGYFWTTYDVAPDGDNLFKNPLLKETGSQKVFRFEASEVIFSLPNGLMGFALFNAKGERQNEAPVDVVRDFISAVPPAPVIANPVSCFRCHGNGILEAKDEIRAHVQENGSEFGFEDIERVEGLYKNATSIKAVFKVDNLQYANALEKLGLSRDRPDPINQVRDEYRFNWTAKAVASLVFLSEQEFLKVLNQSEELREQIGQLATGSTVTFDTLVQAFPTIIRDFQLFEERENGQ